MWIATNRGFLSAVTADPKRLPKAEKHLAAKGTVLTVRARNAAHLRTLFPGRTVYQWPGRDYPARIFIAAAEFAELMAAEVRAIDYGNFKDSVKDNELHDAYMGVWGVMHGYQHGRYRRAPKRDYGQRSFDNWGWDRRDFTSARDINAPFNEQVLDDDPLYLDDGPCSTPGCTDDTPCINCLTAAIEADRYGDFDSGDDRDLDDGAASHRRVAL